MKKIFTLEIRTFKHNDNYEFRLKLFDRWTLVTWNYYPISGQIR